MARGALGERARQREGPAGRRRESAVSPGRKDILDTATVLVAVRSLEPVLADLARTSGSSPPTATRRCCDAFAALDLRDRLAGLTVPALLVAGRQDPATPPAHLREAMLVELPGAAHLAPAQCPRAVLTALRTQLDGRTGRAGLQAHGPSGGVTRRLSCPPQRSASTR